MDEFTQSESYIIFFSFFPAIYYYGKGKCGVSDAFLGLLFILQALCVFSAVALVADKLSAGVMKRPRFAYWMNIAEAFIYVCIGISIFFV